MSPKIDKETTKKTKTKQTRIRQTDVPAYSLEQALRVPEAIHENYGGDPTKPLNVAQAMNLTPSSSNYRQLTGASIAYGLTEGGYNAPEISISELGKRIVSPLEEGGDLIAKREAFLRPRIISEFLNKYDGHGIPRKDIAINVIVDMGVPRERAQSILELILEGASSLGLLSEIKGKKYVNIDASHHHAANNNESLAEDFQYNEEDVIDEIIEENTDKGYNSKAESASENKKMKRVFITHGKNRKFVTPIKKLLAFGELEPIVSVEVQSISEPVPDKVMNDMRSCGAAIIHVDHEQKLIDGDANEHIVLNPNVLIEIGAAMALYGRRFILLVREGIVLPSNLQGLFEVRYNDENLDSDATIRLLEAIKKLKSTSHP